MATDSTADVAPSAPILAGPEEVTPVWLTSVLRATGHVSSNAVRSVRGEAIGHGIVGQIVRFSVAYEPVDDGNDHIDDLAFPIRNEPAWAKDYSNPASVIGKFPGVDSETSPRRIGLQPRLEMLTRELRFYAEVAPDLRLRTPRLYYGRVNAAAGRGLLLFEDFAPGRAGDDVGGGSDDDALCAIDYLARLHASRSSSARLAQLDWIAACDEDVAADLPTHWELLLERFGDRLPQTFRHCVPRLVPAIAAIRRRLTEPPQTLLHGDFRLDNLFLGLPAASISADQLECSKPGWSVAAIDWHSLLRGRGAWDLAYFAGWALPPDQLRRIEAQLLGRYVAGLAAHGVSGYSEEQCRSDYRLGFLASLPRTVAAGATVAMGDLRVRALVEGTIARFAAALSDLQLADLLA